ncbi:MAG TPA: GIDE domain-containing protein [Candidatus Acidoferrales bacterium]|nr:GIDE domain-containing protein [Candidatus Acidoferrales bacterium]
MHHLFDSLVATGATVAGPVLFFNGFRWLRVRRLLDDTPTSRVRSMAMGLVELQGKVAERSRVSAPFSGRPCAYWEVEIAVPSGRGRGGIPSWSTVHRNRSGHPFYLADDTGSALVYPQGAECRLPFGVEEETRGLGVPDVYQQYMEQQGLALRSVWALGPMRFRERLLEEGASVFVLGRAYPRAQSATISWDEEPLAATGTDAASARPFAQRDHDVTGVVRRGPQDPVFVVSPRSEKSMAFEYGWKSLGGLAGGPALALFGMWCLIEMAKAQQLFR